MAAFADRIFAMARAAIIRADGIAAMDGMTRAMMATGHRRAIVIVQDVIAPEMIARDATGPDMMMIAGRRAVIVPCAVRRGPIGLRRTDLCAIGPCENARAQSDPIRKVSGPRARGHHARGHRGQPIRLARGHLARGPHSRARPRQNRRDLGHHAPARPHAPNRQRRVPHAHRVLQAGPKSP